MQLSPKEKAVKQHLIDRLQGDVMLRQTFSGLSYVEKKHVVEELDREFLETEVQKLRKRGKRPAWFIIVGLAALAGLWIWSSYSLGEMTLNYWHGVTDMLIAGAVAVNAFVLYQTHKNRLFIYEGLRILAGSTDDAAQNIADKRLVRA